METKQFALLKNKSSVYNMGMDTAIVSSKPPIKDNKNVVAKYNAVKSRSS